MEFALLAPFLLVLLLFTADAGLALWARFSTLSLANAAARSCGQVLPASPAATTSCAQAFVAANAQPWQLNTLCVGGPIATVSSLTVPAGTTSLELLSVDVACTAASIAFASFHLITFTWTPLLVHGYGVMPYLPTLPLPAGH